MNNSKEFCISLDLESYNPGTIVINDYDIFLDMLRPISFNDAAQFETAAMELLGKQVKHISRRVFQVKEN